MATVGNGSGKRSDELVERPWEYSLRKYLLLLATLVATVTYTAGFTPPGGVWQEKDPGGSYLAGEPILQHKSKTRYAVFFYSNATAFASSLVVIVIILILSVRHELASASLGPLGVLRGFMVLDLISLMVAYTAGIYRARDVPVYTMVLAALTVVYVVVFHVVLKRGEQDGRNGPVHDAPDGPVHDAPDGEVSTMEKLTLEKLRKEREKLSKVLMLLATFAVSVTYLAGLSAPGGFLGDGDWAGDPVLIEGRHWRRLKAFVHLNSTAFFWSLLITVQLLDENLRLRKKEEVKSFRFHLQLLDMNLRVRAEFPRFGLLYTSIVLALLGLVGAYATGSSRDTDTTVYVTLLGVGFPSFVLLLYRWKLGQGESQEANNRKNGTSAAAARAAAAAVAAPTAASAPADVATATAPTAASGLAPTEPQQKEEKDVSNARSVVLLLATLAATITYQAGLDPPGGLWDKDGYKAGKPYKAGDPILRTIYPKRYNAFFYCNSIAFVASLLAIILVKKNLLLKTHALEATMILDLFGLIGAYAAGSCREVSTSIYAMALAGAVLVYVVIHVVFFTLDHNTSGSDDDNEVVEKRRKRLMLFAILAATITYQVGLTPPGGFLLKNDDSVEGHLAGDPVLHNNSKGRYNAFFYCNSVSFMLSIAMIILLMNKNLYRPAIRSHAISVCTAAGMLSLVGAYAAGSTQDIGTSIKIFGLAAAILIAVVAVVIFFVIRSPPDNKKTAPEKKFEEDNEAKKLHSKRKYLMLLGILVASVTYQAGLKPPGGVWDDDATSLGRVPGNPIMRDNGRPRYLAFFYINSTSFVASVVVVILLLLRPPCKDKLPQWLLSAMNITIMLDLLGLLVAYAVGSARSLKTTGYVFALVFMVLAYIAIHVRLASLMRRETKVDNSHSNQEVE